MPLLHSISVAEWVVDLDALMLPALQWNEPKRSVQIEILPPSREAPQNVGSRHIMTPMRYPHRIAF